MAGCSTAVVAAFALAGALSYVTGFIALGLLCTLIVVAAVAYGALTSGRD